MCSRTHFSIDRPTNTCCGVRAPRSTHLPSMPQTWETWVILYSLQSIEINKTCLALATIQFLYRVRWLIWISMNGPSTTFQPRLVVAILKETTHWFALVNGNHRAVLNTKQVSREGARDLQPQHFLHINPESISCHLWLTMLLWTLQPVASSQTAEPHGPISHQSFLLHVLLALEQTIVNRQSFSSLIYIFIYIYIRYLLCMPNFMWSYIMHPVCFRQFVGVIDNHHRLITCNF